MQFSYNDFSCDIEIFKNNNNYIFRLFDSKKNISRDEMANLVIVDPGYGFICVETFPNQFNGLISGYLNSEHLPIEPQEMIDELVLEIEKHLGLEGSYYHIETFDFKDYAEYNGEYDSVYWSKKDKNTKNLDDKY